VQHYEKNIRAATPMIMETIRQAEIDYPKEWVQKAINIAVLHNAYNWAYIETVLKNWKINGKAKKKPDSTDYRRYVKGEYGEFGKR
jgi:DnaD/phage-associated family protein